MELARLCGHHQRVRDDRPRRRQSGRPADLSRAAGPQDGVDHAGWVDKTQQFAFKTQQSAFQTQQTYRPFLIATFNFRRLENYHQRVTALLQTAGGGHDADDILPDGVCPVCVAGNAGLPPKKNNRSQF